MKAQAIDHPQMRMFTNMLGIRKREAIGVIEHSLL